MAVAASCSRPQVIYADGLLTTELVYDSHSVVQLDENRMETVIRLKDKLYDLRLLKMSLHHSYSFMQVHTISSISTERPHPHRG